MLVATPPCQGISVQNHKKKDEINRNSLVVESVEMVDKMGKVLTVCVVNWK